MTTASGTPIADRAMKVGASPTVLDAIYGRRSIRNFTTTPVDAATIRLLLDAAVHAPTAMHEEPCVFAIVQSRDTLRRLSDRAKQMMIEAARHEEPPQAAATPSTLLEHLANPDFNIFYNAGTLVVIGARARGQFVAADCWLAAENLMLAAYSVGLGSCCIGFALSVLNTADAKQQLAIPDDVTVVAAIIVGEPAELVPPVPRKAPEIVSWS